MLATGTWPSGPQKNLIHACCQLETLQILSFPVFGEIPQMPTLQGKARMTGCTAPVRADMNTFPILFTTYLEGSLHL